MSDLELAKAEGVIRSYARSPWGDQLFPPHYLPLVLAEYDRRGTLREALGQLRGLTDKLARLHQVEVAAWAVVRRYDEYGPVWSPLFEGLLDALAATLRRDPGTEGAGE